MSIVSGKMKSKFLVLASTLLICSSAFAAEVNLSEIEFSTANKGYNIVLKTDKNTSFKKTIQNSDRLVIELKNTMTSDDFSTIYNDVSDINNVTVTPVGRDDLRIQIQGHNINNSFINIDTSADSPVVQQNFNENQINLNMPIENYKPVYNEIDNEDDEIEEEGLMSETLSKLNPLATLQKHQTSSNKMPNKKNDYKWLTYLGLAIIMFSAAKNLFKPTQSVQIGLSQNIKDREKEIAEKLNNSVKETLSLRSKIAQNTSAPSINYGLKSYQNSQKNPYENVAPAIKTIRKTDSPIQPATLPKTSTLTSTTRPKPITNSLASRKDPITRPVSLATSSYRESSSVDSKKFLEAMTKIYEKNGRTDLAQGLKNNINKANF